MKRAPTSLRAIGGFGVAVAFLSVAATAAVVVLAPEPAQPRMTAADAVAALKGSETALDRRIGPPPEGPRATVIEGIIAGQLGRPLDEVRVVWPADSYESYSRQTFRIPVEAMADRAREAPSKPFVMIGRPDGTLRQLPSQQANRLLEFSLLPVPFPAFAASVRQADGQWLTVERPSPFLTGWQRNMLIALGISLLLLAPLAWIFARRLTRPFRALAGALEVDDAPIPTEGPRELREAASAIAAMRNRLTQEATERARILTAVAHDLRTPLTGLRLRVEHVAEPHHSRMVGDIERMQSMIGEVLGSARDAAMPVERIDVRPFVERVVSDMDGAPGSIAVLPGDEAAVAVSSLAFRRVVENLVRNAIDYAGAGEIAIAADSGTMVLTVADRGPGIAEQDRARLLQPFERGEASRNRETGGTGLGLSIVRDFAIRHRGEFALSEASGGGTLAELRLPTA